MGRTALPPDALELEITENIALGNDEAVLASLRSLRAIGVGLAFDDFGTGYASLSYLMRYPLTRIKIDRSFVRKIGEKPLAEDTAIVRSIITMGHNLGFAVTAKGIETVDQAAFLQAKRCDEAQGFFYAKPLPAEQFEAFLGSTRRAALSPPRSDAVLPARDRTVRIRSIGNARGGAQFRFPARADRNAPRDSARGLVYRSENKLRSRVFSK